MFKPYQYNNENDIIFHHTGNFDWSCYKNKKIVSTDQYSEFPENCIVPGNLYFSAHSIKAITIPIGPQIGFIPKKSDVSRKLCFSQFDYRNNRANMDFIKQLKFNDSYELSTSENYVLNLNSYKYTISPHGYHADCHRHWEAIQCGCIPITIKHPLLEPFLEAPILFLNTWDELTEILLIEKYDEVCKKNWSMACPEYWIDFIKNYKYPEEVL
jgi:hypothetical protein